MLDIQRLRNGPMNSNLASAPSLQRAPYLNAIPTKDVIVRPLSRTNQRPINRGSLPTQSDPRAPPRMNKRSYKSFVSTQQAVYYDNDVLYDVWIDLIPVLQVSGTFFRASCRTRRLYSGLLEMKSW